MLIKIDQELFLFLNSLNSPFWDQVMYVISGRLTWVPLYLAVLYILIKKYRRKMLIIVIMIAITVTIGDQLSVMIKNIVQRPRPCHEPALVEMIHLVKGRCGGLYGFVSSHAVNSFSVALLSLSLIRLRWFSVGMIFWAGIVGYSRVYLGVHYPGDVLFGSVLGALTGWGVFKLYELIDKKFLTGSIYFNPLQTDTD